MRAEFHIIYERHGMGLSRSVRACVREGGSGGEFMKQLECKHVRIGKRDDTGSSVILDTTAGTWAVRGSRDQNGVIAVDE